MITYDDKVQLAPNANPPENVWSADDANEVKTEVNANITATGSAASAADAAQATADSAQTAAAAAQSNIDTHEALTNNPHSVTKSQVGLSNVDNTSDSSKPISTATQTALDLKTDLASTLVSITGATVLTSTAFGKVHVCTGTSADYDLTLPTAAGSTGQRITIKGAAALTKVVTVLCNGAETIDGYTTRKLSTNGLFVVMSDGTNWVMVNEVGSWIPFPGHNSTGFSASPTVAAKFFRVGKNAVYEYFCVGFGTSNATTYTVAAPFPAKAAKDEMCYIANSGTIAVGRYTMTAGSATITLFSTLAGNAFTASGNKLARFTITYEIE